MAEEKPLHVEFKFTDDTHTVVRFELPPRLEADAAGMTRLINLMTLVRSKMEPPFPAEPVKSGEDAHVIDDPDVGVELSAYGVTVALLHPGLGWIHARLTREQGQRFASDLSRCLALAHDPPKH